MFRVMDVLSILNFLIYISIIIKYNANKAKFNLYMLRAVPTVYTSILPDITFRQKKTVLLAVNFRQRVFNKMAVKTN